MAAKKERNLADEIFYSERVHDDYYEYRHVILPKELAEKVPKDHFMTEEEWRRLGICQSVGWVCLLFFE
ncbi:putative cyclin-dependent kinase regulatory subunit CKS1 [Monocercomonoides exilis]|uniref:putative cyclin-dependent kinase regulatory subunit CKS1 n=1 Tax=Monocercomonoides exilis TaxID=2049356 RepID=UPI003559DDFD|nr:putative cyclin-dependent kinase regulatory subunit CKS1 [Monocercomonoides exilis]